jgi:hypothetical protein
MLFFKSTRIWLLLFRYIEVVFKMYTIFVVATIFTFRVKAHRSYFLVHRLYMDTSWPSFSEPQVRWSIHCNGESCALQERLCATSTVKKLLPVRYVYLHSVIKSCQAIIIPRKYGCMCVAWFEGGRPNTTGNSLFAVTIFFSPLCATIQLAVPMRNMFAPDQKSLKSLKII